MPSISKTKTFRITNTQFALLESPKNKSKASAIVRVLLSLYFNGRLAMDDVQRLIDEDLQISKERNVATKKGDK